MTWQVPAPKWDTLAGRGLDTFFAGVHAAMPDYDLPLTIFGSAPIQLCLDEAFTSADVDIMVLSNSDPLREVAARLGVGRSGTIRPTFGIQLCPAQMLKPTPHYLQRAYSETRHGLKVIVPHLRDILIAKLHRSRTEDQDGLVPKDRRAFTRVRQLSNNHPTEADLIEDLISCEPHFRQPLDGSINAFWLNVEDLFLNQFDRRIDIQTEIILPARAAEDSLLRNDSASVAEMLAELRPSRE